jgi:hypothetical protein
VKDAPGGLDGSVDMSDRTIAQTIRKRVAFAAGDIRARPAKVIDRLVNATAVIRALIHHRVVSKTLPVIDRGMPDLVDGRIDSTDRLNLIHTLLPVARAVLDEPTRGAQI